MALGYKKNYDETLFKNPLTGFDLQLFAGEGEGGTGEGSGGQAGQGSSGTEDYIEKEDPVTKKMVKIPKSLDVLLGHYITSTRNSIEGKYKPLLETLEKDKTELVEVKAELDKIKEESMTAEERAQKNAEKRIKEIEATALKDREESKKFKTLFEKTTIRNDLYGSFGDVKLCNPEQVATLLESEGNARVEEKVDDLGKPTGKYETRLTLEITNEKGDIEVIEGTPKAVFQKWINQERNLHHQINNLNPGGNSGGMTRRGGKVDYSTMKPTDRLNAARQVKQ